MDRPVQSGFDFPTWPILKPKEGLEDFEIVPMEWGFIPRYLKNRDAVEKFRKGYKDANGKFHPAVTTLNAVGEEMLLHGKMFRESAIHRRCLVLSSGFYEWRHIAPMGKKGQPLKTTIKYPYHIKVKEKKYFFMAGIWAPWHDNETGEYIETFAILTTAANSLMQQVHNSKMRMPVMLEDDLAYEWIFNSLTEERITAIGTTQYSSISMQAVSVAKDFREALNPETPFHYEALPELLNN